MSGSCSTQRCDPRTAIKHTALLEAEPLFVLVEDQTISVIDEYVNSSEGTGEFHND